MKYAVLGTGGVGRTIGSKLIELGHEVSMGSRTAENPAASAWREAEGQMAHQATFADAAAFGEVVVLCLRGGVAVDVVTSIAESLDGKVVIDICNPLDFSTGFPGLDPVGTDSLGEQIQRAAPTALVVKTLNNVNSAVMVDPSRVRAQTLFVSGDAASAKDQVRNLLHEFGWSDAAIIDIGGIQTARATEMILPLWVLLSQTLGTADFGIHVTH